MAKKNKPEAGVPLQMRTEDMVAAVGNKTLDKPALDPEEEPTEPEPGDE